MFKLESRYRYPIFFVGLLLMEAAGFLFRYAGLGLRGTEALVVMGFVLFLLSLIMP